MRTFSLVYRAWGCFCYASAAPKLELISLIPFLARREYGGRVCGLLD